MAYARLCCRGVRNRGRRTDNLAGETDNLEVGDDGRHPGCSCRPELLADSVRGGFANGLCGLCGSRAGVRLHQGGGGRTRNVTTADRTSPATYWTVCCPGVLI